MGSITVPVPFTLKDEPIENVRPMKVRVIGAGYSGIYMGVRLPQRIQNLDFAIYEKNDGIGGTWWENTYPGVACDVPCKQSSGCRQLLQAKNHTGATNGGQRIPINTLSHLIPDGPSFMPAAQKLGIT